MKTEIIITHVAEKKFGFGVTTDTGEQTFIAPNVIVEADAQTGMTFAATLVPNHLPEQRARTPYQCVKLEPLGINVSNEVIDEFEEPSEDVALEFRIVDLLNEAGCPMTTDEIAKSVGSTSRELSQFLKTMNDHGMIVKEEIWARGTQKRPSHVYWGATVETFIQ